MELGMLSKKKNWKQLDKNLSSVIYYSCEKKAIMQKFVLICQKNSCGLGNLYIGDQS